LSLPFLYSIIIKSYFPRGTWIKKNEVDERRKNRGIEKEKLREKKKLKFFIPNQRAKRIELKRNKIKSLLTP
jgi:hypothetical protein